MQAIISPSVIHNVTTIFLLAAASFCLTMASTPIYTYFVYRFNLWKAPGSPSVDQQQKVPLLAKLHAVKHSRNIPMMAGVVFVTVIVVLTCLFNRDLLQTWLLLAALLGGALVGFIDDIINVRGLGGTIKQWRGPIKFILITCVGLVLAWFFYDKLGYTSIHLPWGNWSIGWWMVPLFAFVVVATGNAVNITDGVDGLAGGLSAMSFGSFGVIALLQGNVAVAAFCATVVGALLAYTWFNIYPARFFMSDVGSFGLGASLGVVAMLTNTLFLLPIIGFVFVADAGTSLLQIVGNKVFHRKILLTAPIHHHLQAIGWPETKVTMRFWIVGQVCGLVGMLIALAGGYIW